MALPSNPFGSYWPWWSPGRRLVDWPTDFNVLLLFAARPVGGVPGTTGAVAFNSASTANQFTGAPNTNMNADIATCRARGQRVILSVGGAGGQITINTQARADAFIASIKSINVQLGGSGTTKAIDGLDWNNFEGANISGQAQWMTYVGQQLKAFYGDFIISAPPAAFSLSSGGQGGIDRVLLATMHAGNALDWLCPQFYDGLNQISTVRAALDFYNTAIVVGGNSVQIPRSKIGIGFGMNTQTWNSSQYWYLADAITCFNQMIAEGKAPKGTFNWAFNLDQTNPLVFPQLKPYVNNYTDTDPDPPDDPPPDPEPDPDPAFELALSSNFTNGAVTTARLFAPTDKTTDDFQAGTINETSNPAAALNLAEDTYTELEWNLVANTTAISGQQYEFRVTSSGTSLDTYSVTPRWTIGTPPTEPPPPGSSSLIASTSAVGNTDTVTTSAINTTGATILVVGIAVGNGTPVVSDSKSNTWIPLNSSQLTVKTQLYYAQNPTVGTGHTFTCAGATIYPSIE